MSSPAPPKLQFSPSSSPHPPIRIPTSNPKLFLRRWNPGDVPALTHAANNRKIWMNLRDKFPSPYTTADAEYYTTKAPATQVCVEYDGVAVGGIGFTIKEDIERCTAEVGYWLGEDVWGLGIASAALVAVCKWAFETAPGVERLYALPFAHNPASRKVLEKGGFTLDAVLKRAAIKDAKVIDMAMYSLLRPGAE